MNLLNLGCGNVFHNDWTNIDFVSRNEKVKSYDLRKGIPFGDNTFDVVYHSHLLEHFSKKEAEKFMKECYRVLKPGGILRVVVPDLEEIVRLYLKFLELALQGDEKAKLNYEWMMLEMYDQTVRNYSGGYMKEYLCRPILDNEDFVYQRLGYEAKAIRENCIRKQPKLRTLNERKNNKKNLFRFFKLKTYKEFLKRKLFADELEYIKIGKFRLSGEIHQWMYDRYSLSSLLEKIGFKEIKQVSYNQSDILNWPNYKLEEVEDQERKPDSLYFEAKKL